MLNKRLMWVLLAGLMTTSATAQQTSTVSVDVKLVRLETAAALKDSSRVAVWLVPLDHAAFRESAVKDKHYRMAQRNKHFEPTMLVIPVGGVVDFPNFDPWFHNVFSLYRGKRFDLGLYQAGSQRSVRFDKLGPSYLFCNIHPGMSAVILAVESDLSGISGKTGRVEITKVPPGRYELHVWHEQATTESLDRLQRTIVVPGGERGLAPITIAVRQPEVRHKNKYGQDYDPDSLQSGY
jgi:plastocyanin